jgi:cytoskeletal protein CcmA (bactofilin family)
MGIFGKPPETKSPEPLSGAPAPKPAAIAPPTSQPSGARGGTCVIGARTVIKGEVTGDEDVLVEGIIEGEIRIARDLRVGQGGSVKATITAQSVVVSGEVVGDCQAENRVEIQASGRVTGNIRAPKIVIAEGAMFKGNSDMSGRKDERKDKLAVS